MVSQEKLCHGVLTPAMTGETACRPLRPLRYGKRGISAAGWGICCANNGVEKLKNRPRYSRDGAARAVFTGCP